MEWRRIHFTVLARALARGWHFQKKAGTHGLWLRSRTGGLWDFKLVGKAWVRRLIW
jgi:frataxin-like iron-binding protein CyaY